MNNSNRLLNYSLYYALAVFAATFTIASPIMIEISNDISVNVSNMGLLLTLFSTGFVAGSLLTGFFTRFIRKISLINLTIIIQAFFIAAFGFSKFFILMLFLYFFIGLTGGLIETTISLALPEINKARAGYYMNISQVFFGLGAFTGPYISSFSVKAGMSWRFSYFFLAVLSLISFILLMSARMRHSTKTALLHENTSLFNKTEEKNNPLKKALAIKLFILFSFIMFLYVAAEDGLNAWIPTFFRLEREFSAHYASQILSFYWLAIAAGRLIISLLVKKINLFKLTIIISTAGFATMLSGLLIEQKYLNLILFMLTGLFFSGIWPNVIALSINYFSNDKRKDTLVSLIVSIGGIGALIAPWMVGSIFEKSSLFFGLLVCVIFMLIEIILLVLLSRIKPANLN